MDLRPNHSEIEIKIVTGCLNNDRKSQKEFFDRYKDAMYTVVYRILRDAEMASDALQDGFISGDPQLMKYYYRLINERTEIEKRLVRLILQT